MLLFIAGNFPIAKRYCDKHRLTDKDVTIVNDHYQILGIERGTIVLIHPSFFDRKDWGVFNDVLAVRSCKGIEIVP